MHKVTNILLKSTNLPVLYPSRDGTNCKSFKGSRKWLFWNYMPTLTAMSAPLGIILHPCETGHCTLSTDLSLGLKGGKEVPMKQAKDAVFSQVLLDSYF